MFDGTPLTTYCIPVYLIPKPLRKADRTWGFCERHKFWGTIPVWYSNEQRAGVASGWYRFGYDAFRLRGCTGVTSVTSSTVAFSNERIFVPGFRKCAISSFVRTLTGSSPINSRITTERGTNGILSFTFASRFWKRIPSAPVRRNEMVTVSGGSSFLMRLTTGWALLCICISFKSKSQHTGCHICIDGDMHICNNGIV